MKNQVPVILQVGGKTVFSGEININALLEAVLAQSSEPKKVPKSTPLNAAQVRALASKVDPKTVQFLRQIAENNGAITFAEMCEIFAIKTWTEYASRYGKGLTRALRHLVNDPTASLVWWNDSEWTTDNDPEGEVYIDNPTLAALKEAMGG